MKLFELNEGFVSRLTNLNGKDLESAYKKEYGTPIEIVYSSFVKLDKGGSVATYKVASRDNESDEFIINDFYLSHYLNGGIKLDDVSQFFDLGQFL